jgi:hypothetical protein
MRLITPTSLALLIAVAFTAPAPDDNNAAALAMLDELAQLATTNELAALENATTKRSTTCNRENMSVRKEWCVVVNP